MAVMNQKYKIFGRTRGRSKKFNNSENYLELFKKYKIDNLTASKTYLLDIGTGYGETTIYLAQKNKNKKIIACEKYIDGNLNLIKNIKKNKINNIYLHTGNVYEILDQFEKKITFESIWIFFPDPWPKKRHFKRRLITEKFLNYSHSFIKKNGHIYIATDSTSYIKQIISSIYKCRNLFEWSNQNALHLNISDYFNIETKFLKKAIISGRKPSLFILKKI